MNNKLFISFDINPSKEYPCIVGNTYGDNFNETIDSLSVVLDDIQERIEFNRPYHFCKIVNKDENGFKWNNKNYIIMLLDNYVETETDIFNHIYKYQINLMNCVKLLEKVQCSNLMITHSLVNGRKTIYDYINQYMKVYCPKIKITEDGENWRYDYLLKWDNLDTRPFNTTVAADMQMNNPTLRELITNLMLQVGCIPTLEYRTLKYINFREKPTEFVVAPDSGISSIVKSSASDSYANTLISQPSQILDASNEVLVERLGFRDNENAIIDQSNNLKLNVRFPIYNINKVKLQYGLPDTFYYQPTGQDNSSYQEYSHRYPIINTNYQDTVGYRSTGVWNKLFRLPSDTFTYWQERSTGTTGNGDSPCIFLTGDMPTINICFSYCNLEEYHKGTLKNVRVHFCIYDDTEKKYTEFSSVNTGDVEWYLNLGDNSEDLVIDASDLSGGYNQELINFEIPQYRYVEGLPAGVGEHKYPGDLGHIWSGSAPANASGFTYMLQLSLENAGILGKFNDLKNKVNDKERAIYMWFENEFVDAYTGETIYQFIPLRQVSNPYDISTIQWQNPINIDLKTKYGNSNNFVNKFGNPSTLSYVEFYDGMYMQLPQIQGGWFADITKLFVEAGKRQLLNTDFRDLDYVDTIDELARYVYGTVSYNIGGKEIVGFSQKYSEAVAWWSQTQTYFDAIVEFLAMHDVWDVDLPSLQEQEELLSIYAGMPITKGTIYFNNYGTPSYTPYKANYLFIIHYQPINSYKMKLTKEQDANIPLEIQQLNQTSSGLEDFYRTTKNNQDIINRVGNEILQITQVTDDISKINKLNSVYNDKYTIFKRDISIKENFIEVLYTASEKYVMQNYFTSIVSKYRSYEYVDYNASIVRKENKTIYCLLSTDKYYDGDDNIKWETIDESILLSGFLGIDATSEKSVKYNLKTSWSEEGPEQTIKNEISVLASKNSLSIVYEDYDNVSAGPYIINPTQLLLGGIQQKWQIWDQEKFNEKHAIDFIHSFTLNPNDIDSVSLFPLMDNAVFDILFSLVDDNKDPNKYDFTFYKDNAEIINQTLQFMFYSDTNEIEFTQNFIKNNWLVDRREYEINTIYIGSDDTPVYDLPSYRPPFGPGYPNRTAIGNFSDYVNIYKDEDTNHYCIEIDWPQIIEDANGAEFTKIFISHAGQVTTPVRQRVCLDYVIFKRREEVTKYYLTLNDTKTNDVWYFKSDDDLFEIYEVTNGEDRKCNLKN